MGEGNDFQHVLVGPSVERLLNLQIGELVLEIGCGNGVFARRMALPGAQIIATDFSARLLGTCFRAGLVMDGIDEPAFDHPHNGSRHSPRALAWINYRQIPPARLVRMRIA